MRLSLSFWNGGAALFGAQVVLGFVWPKATQSYLYAVRVTAHLQTPLTPIPPLHPSQTAEYVIQVALGRTRTPLLLQQPLL